MTLADLMDRVRVEAGMEEEQWVADDELIDYINEGIDEAESEIHTIYEDYFLDKMPMPITANTDSYTLPSNIYANKIRKIMYDNGSKSYPIVRIRKIEDTVGTSSSDFYQYMLINSASLSAGSVSAYNAGLVTFSASHNLAVGDRVEFFTAGGVTRGTDVVATVVDSLNVTLTTGIGAIIATDTCTRLGGNRIKLYPTAQETSATNISIWYLRQAKTLTATTDSCDIPEFEIFVINYAKVKCIEKDLGSPALEKAVMNLERSRAKMVETLKLMVPDDDNYMTGDLSFYSDFDTEDRGYYNKQ